MKNKSILCQLLGLKKKFKPLKNRSILMIPMNERLHKNDGLKVRCKMLNAWRWVGNYVWSLWIFLHLATNQNTSFIFFL